MKIQELLSSKDKWTQKVPATDKNEQHVKYNSPDAIKWCLVGAIYKCYESEGGEIIARIRKEIKKGVSIFNDSSSYEEVMELVRRLDI